MSGLTAKYSYVGDTAAKACTCPRNLTWFTLSPHERVRSGDETVVKIPVSGTGLCGLSFSECCLFFKLALQGEIDVKTRFVAVVDTDSWCQ